MASPQREDYRLRIHPVLQRAQHAPVIMRPDTRLDARIDCYRVCIVQVVAKGGVTRRDGGFPANHELHDGNAQTFGLGDIDIKVGARNQVAVVFAVEKSMYQDDIAGKRRHALQQVMEFKKVTGLRMVRHLENQRRIRAIGERHAECGHQQAPVLAVIARIENAGENHALEPRAVPHVRRCESAQARVMRPGGRRQVFDRQASQANSKRTRVTLHARRRQPDAGKAENLRGFGEMELEMLHLDRWREHDFARLRSQVENNWTAGVESESAQFNIHRNVP